MRTQRIRQPEGVGKEQSKSPRVVFTLLHADAIEIGNAIRGRGIGITRRAGLADDVALDGGESGLRREIGGALQIIGSICHALPANGHTR